MRNIPSHPGGGGVIGGGSHSKPENRPRENGSVITQIKQGVAVLVYDPSTGSGAEIRRTEAGLPEWRSSGSGREPVSNTLTTTVMQGATEEDSSISPGLRMNVHTSIHTCAPHEHIKDVDKLGM